MMCRCSAGADALGNEILGLPGIEGTGLVGGDAGQILALQREMRGGWEGKGVPGGPEGGGGG